MRKSKLQNQSKPGIIVLQFGNNGKTYLSLSLT